MRDARFALRLLVKERWFTATAILVLSLGIAANNTVFVLTNGLLLRDLPFADPDRIVTIGTSVGGANRPNAGISYLDLQDWSAAQRTFDGLAGVTETTMNVADEGDPGALHWCVCLGERVQPHRPCAGHRSRLRRERRSSGRGSGGDPERRAVAHALSRAIVP